MIFIPPAKWLKYQFCSSNFFPNETLTRCPFFSLQFQKWVKKTVWKPHSKRSLKLSLKRQNNTYRFWENRHNFCRLRLLQSRKSCLSKLFFKKWESIWLFEQFYQFHMLLSMFRVLFESHSKSYLTQKALRKLQLGNLAEIFFLSIWGSSLDLMSKTLTLLQLARYLIVFWAVSSP